MNYIYCGAHKPLLFANALKESGENITIITDNEDVKKFCISEKIDYIEFESVSYTVGNILKIIFYKKKLDHVLDRINIQKEDCFYLISSKIKCYPGFYMAKELAKKGSVIYKDPHDQILEKYVPKKNKPVFFRGLIIKNLLHYGYGLDLVYYKLLKSPSLGIDDSFLKKHNIKIYEPNEYYHKLSFEGIKNSKRNCRDFDSLIIDSGSLENRIVQESIDAVFEKILKLPVEYAFKKHPSKVQNHSDMAHYKIYEQCEEIPSYMPIELFYNNIKRNVVSINSASLITASQLQHLKVISLLELVDWCHESFKKENKQNLIEKSKNKILFPTSFEELKEIML